MTVASLDGACSVIVSSGVSTSPASQPVSTAVTTFCSIGDTMPLVVAGDAPGLAAVTVNVVSVGTLATARFVTLYPAGALPDVVTCSPTVNPWAATVVNVIELPANVAAEIPMVRPLTVAVPATVRPRSMKPIVVRVRSPGRPGR